MATPIPQNEATFTLGEIAAATAGEVRRGDATTSVRGVVIDSRAVTEGCLFVALRGERHDAHGFVAQALAAGAAAVLVARGAEVADELGGAVIEVPDTTRALGDLAHAHRARWNGTVVAITGSAGKTTTKELVAAALTGTGASVHKTSGNLNNLFGVPMTLFELSQAHDFAVVEVGTSKPGEIARLAEIAAPNVAVVTLVAAAHTEGLGSVEDVAAEKWSLIEALPADGTAIVNADDPHLHARVFPRGVSPRKHFVLGRIRFGRGEGADVRVVEAHVTGELRTAVRLAVRDAGELELELGLLGEAAAQNAAAAVAVCVALGRDLAKAAAGMAAVLPTPGRMRPLHAVNGALVLDDAYNANPRSTALAIDTAAEVARRRGGGVIAVLGDMKELGERSADEHGSVGRQAARSGARVLAACGPEMRHAAYAARRESKTMEVHHFDDPLEAIDRALGESGPTDVVLVKGSRSMRMERVVAALTGSAEDTP